MKILYKFPSRQRPDKFFSALENIYVNSRHNDFTILATLDEDDITMNNEDVIRRMKNYPELIYKFGKSSSKIHAVNRDMEAAPDFDILIVMSDDMVFTEVGFDETIIKDMQESFHDMDGVLHYPDGNRTDIATMCILTKKYYNAKGYIYYPGYITWFADNEFTAVAKKESKYKFINKNIFRHLHYQWIGCEGDELYKKNDHLPTIYNDEQLFNLRCGY